VSPRRLVVVLMLAAAAFALAATLTGSPVAGWISVALFRRRGRRVRPLA